MTRLTVADDGHYEYNGSTYDLNDDFRRHELQKAVVTAGYPNIAPGTNAANILEDVSGIQVVVTTEEEDLTLLKLLTKEVAHSTVFQYSVLSSYGNPAATYYMPEYGLPRSPGSVYKRANEEVRFMGTLGGVTYAANLSNALMDPKTQARRDCAQALLESVESEILNGVSALRRDGTGWDGWRQQILTRSPSSNIFDLHNTPLTSLKVDAALGVAKRRPNNAKITHLLLGPENKQAYNRSYNPILRADATAAGARGYNLEFDRYQSSAGTINVIESKFLNNDYDGTVPVTQAPGAPSAPVVTAAPAAAAPTGVVTSNFQPSDAGTYYYWAQAQNDNGVSPLVQLNTTALNVSAGQVVSFTLTDGSTNGIAADFFYIYRTQKNDPNANNFFQIHRLPNIYNGMGMPTAYTDVNFRMPNTSYGILFQNNIQACSWVQLMPLMTQGIGVRATADEFMMLLFGVPAFKAPGRFILLMNIQSGATALTS